MKLQKKTIVTILLSIQIIIRVVMELVMSPNVVCNTCIFHLLYESVMVRILQGVSPSIWDHNLSYGSKWTATCLHAKVRFLSA